MVQSLLQRFQREVWAAAKLNHPNIVTAYDADEAGGTHFLVMQYVEGTDLSQLVRANEPLSVDQSLTFLIQAARGLKYAHENGVVHRDVKPANMLLDGDGVVRILDMGLARFESAGVERDAQLTGTGQVMGTVDYMAPEQAIDTHSADGRADIYALGCTLYYFLTGNALYGGQTMASKLMAHQSAEIPALPEHAVKACPSLEPVYRKMVAKRPDDRYQSMADLLGDLEACQSGNPLLSVASMAAGSGSSSALNHFLKNLEGQQPGTAAAAEKTVIAPLLADPEETLISASPDEGTNVTNDFNIGTMMKSSTRPAEPTRVRPPTSKEDQSPAAARGSINRIADRVETAKRQSSATESRLSGRGRSGRGNNMQKWLLFGGAGFVALIIVAGIIIRVKNKDGSISEVKLPNAESVLEVVQDPPLSPANPAKGEISDRGIAEMMLKFGGTIRLADANGGYTDKEIKNISELPGPWIRVYGIYLTKSHELSAITDETLEQLSHLRYLASLTLHTIPLDDSRVNAITDRLPRLTELQLWNCGISDDGVAMLTKLQELKQLSITNTDVTDAGVKALKSLVKLRKLQLNGTSVTDEGLAMIADNHPQLISLGLSSTNISNLGMESIQRLAALQFLAISYTRVTDDGLAAIGGLPN